MNSAEELLNFLSKWGADNGFDFVVPKDDTFINFIKIDLNSRRIFVNEIDELTDYIE